MAISSTQLTALTNKLQSLLTQLQKDPRPASAALADDDAVVMQANACDFALPSPLTLETLATTVEKKLANVAVLLERSLMHESLPPEAQAAAEEENKYIENNYKDEPVP